LIQQPPERAMRGSIAKRAQALLRPGGLIAMECDDAVGEPGDVAGQLFSLQRRHADAVQELAADAAKREIHQRRRAHVEGEAVASIKARAAAWLTVRLEDDG
jgi:hypothetical protein